MKKLLVFLFLLLLPLTITVAEESPLYIAVTDTDFSLRPAKESEEKLLRIPLNSKVKIYEVSDDWCRITVLGEEGWCKARWLDRFISAPIQQEPQYQAITDQEFAIRLAPESDIVIGRAPLGKFITVLKYGEEWCQVAYDGMVGWCKTHLLWGFRSLNVLEYPAIGVQPNIGFVTLNQETWISSKDFIGMEATADSLICVRSMDENEYSLPVWRSESTIPRQAGELTPFHPWDQAAPGDLIGGFTTFYDKNYGKELAENRAHNIAVACERIHDLVLQPGEQFSYNALCAPYRKSNGYLLGPNISDDGEGFGGGVCQLTTTLYNALLPLPLQLDEWRVHQKIGVLYVPQFFDAAVGSFSDLIFTNTLPYPIRIFAQPQNGAITVLLFRDGSSM